MSGLQIWCGLGLFFYFGYILHNISDELFIIRERLEQIEGVIHE